MIIVDLVLSAVAIVVAAALFTNAVELLGERLNLEKGYGGERARHRGHRPAGDYNSHGCRRRLPSWPVRAPAEVDDTW
jgi:hypothetical protein